MIVGTDTGVGKTVVGLVLAAALRRRGVDVAGMKPLESGCAPHPEDARLWSGLTGVPLEQVCLYALKQPVAPQSAAEAEGVCVDMSRVEAGLSALCHDHERVFVESAGGLGSPLAPGVLGWHLARQLGVSVLLVGHNRLGTVGQMLVSVELLRRLSIPCVGMVLSQTDPQTSGPEVDTHQPLLRQYSAAPLLGLLPYLGQVPGPEQVEPWATSQAAALEGQLDLTPLI